MAAVVGALVSVQEVERLERIERKIFRDPQNAFDLSDERFIKMFRLSKELVINITEEVKHCFPSGGMPAHLRILVALRFYAAGSYQLSVGSNIFLSVSQKQVSRCIRQVSSAIMHTLMPKEIKFPTIEEQEEIKRRIYATHNFPGVVGAIDCTLIKIVCPKEDSTAIRQLSFMSRKGAYSLNVQLVVDDTLMIRSANARYPGSVHDSFIWKHCMQRNHLSNQRNQGVGNFWLLGDSGYPLEPWLLTPHPHPAIGTQKFRYNRYHASIRSCIERCNGVLKGRFRCILKHRVLHYEPEVAAQIIYACTTLHNMCLKHNTPYEDSESDSDFSDSGDETEDSDDDSPPLSFQSSTLFNVAKAIRDQITSRF